MLQLADFVRLAQRTQHIEGGAGPHVGTDAELHPLAPGLLQIEQPAAEEQVRGGAKRDCRAGLAQAVPLLLLRVQAVGEHAFAADHAIAVVNVQIALALREQ